MRELLSGVVGCCGWVFLGKDGGVPPVVGSGQWAVGSGQWAVGSRQWPAEGGNAEAGDAGVAPTG